ncbi:uncharacterized protein LOC135474001 [Liolophura sinensis]|uniref:uncharacterized protein LOC135474001 n=1 Tax=Liolophura sinensis TaxID=3198878 RepID=UPI00315921BB
MLTAAVLADEECHWNGQMTKGHCQCFSGFYRSDCSGDCGCNGYGTCKTDHTCECEEGWKWSSTERKCVWDCHCADGAKCIGPGVCGCKSHCVHGDCWNGQCECWEGYKGATCATFDPNSMMNKGVNVGMNLGGITYYSSEIKFVDVLKESAEWITQRTDGHEWNTQEQNKLHLRPDGYPASLDGTLVVGKLFFRGVGNYQPHSDYTLLYDGEGHIVFKLVNHKILKQFKGRWLIHFEPGHGGIFFSITKTNPHNPLRNVRIVLPGFEDRYEKFPFNPVFQEPLRRYSVIRFMDFLHTNGHGPEPTTWATRRKPDFHTQQGNSGGALEYMIQLCNTMGISPWFNMPHAADDDFVRKFAQEVKKSLRPDLHVYVEYSNEVWNGIFRQAKYSQEQGVKLHLDSEKWKAGYKFYNKRAGEVADIWSSVYGHSEKLVTIWAWQTGNFDYSRQVMSHLGENTKKFKAVAVTGYMDCGRVADKDPKFVDMSMAEILQHCQNDINNNYPKTWGKFLNMAKDHGLKLLTYEAGPSVSEGGAIVNGANKEEVTNKAIAFNKDSHIETAVYELLNKWNGVIAKAPGNSFPGGLFNYFASTGEPSKYGSWGMLQYTGQDPSTVPKYRGVQRYITNHFPNNPLGPRCSFVKDGALWFGCFQQGNKFQCGQSDTSGRSWAHYPDLHLTEHSFLVLDGYDLKLHLAYIRAVDKIGVNSYHTIDTRSHHAWKSLTANDYHAYLAYRHVTRRLPNGVHNGLAAPSSCH